MTAPRHGSSKILSRVLARIGFLAGVSGLAIVILLWAVREISPGVASYRLANNRRLDVAVGTVDDRIVIQLLEPRIPETLPSSESHAPLPRPMRLYEGQTWADRNDVQWAFGVRCGRCPECGNDIAQPRNDLRGELLTPSLANK